MDRLVDLNAAGNAGTLIGPALAGTLAAFGLPFALVAAGIGAAIAIVGTPLLIRLDAYDRRRSVGTTRLLRRDGVDVACWSSVVGGGWWAMLGSYIPVILVGAGLGAGAVGLARDPLGRRVDRRHPRLARPCGGPRPPGGRHRVVRDGRRAWSAWPSRRVIHVAYALLLIVGGLASGTVTTLGPALASLAASVDEQGDALSLTGMFRAAALLATPAMVGALLGVVSLAAAMSLLGVGLGLPGAALTRSRRGTPPGVRAAGSASP